MHPTHMCCPSHLLPLQPSTVSCTPFAIVSHLHIHPSYVAHTQPRHPAAAAPSEDEGGESPLHHLAVWTPMCPNLHHPSSLAHHSNRLSSHPWTGPLATAGSTQAGHALDSRLLAGFSGHRDRCGLGEPSHLHSRAAPPSVLHEIHCGCIAILYKCDEVGGDTVLWMM